MGNNLSNDKHEDFVEFHGDLVPASKLEKNTKVHLTKDSDRQNPIQVNLREKVCLTKKEDISIGDIEAKYCNKVNPAERREVEKKLERIEVFKAISSTLLGLLLVLPIVLIMLMPTFNDTNVDNYLDYLGFLCNKGFLKTAILICIASTFIRRVLNFIHKMIRSE